MTFTPAELAAAIREHLPGFNVQYLPDFREGIARSWPTSIDDACARRDWGWAPRYDLQARALSVSVRPPAAAFLCLSQGQQGRQSVKDIVLDRTPCAAGAKYQKKR